jgi:hypothetical protein
MESIGAKMKIYLGEFDVVQVKFDGISINIGKQIHITIHVGDFPHNVQVGDKIPLYTEISDAIPRPTPE